MSNLQHLRSRLAEFTQASEGMNDKRVALEQSITRGNARLSDLEQGIGAPPDVPSWLRMKREIETSIQVDRAELASLADLHASVSRGSQEIHAQLEGAELDSLVEKCLASEYPEYDRAMSKAHAALSRIYGLFHYLNRLAAKMPLGSKEQLRMLKRVEQLPRPIDMEVTHAQTESAAAFWATVHIEVAKLSEPTPSLDQAAE